MTQTGGTVNLGTLTVSVNSTSTGIVNVTGGAFNVLNRTINNGSMDAIAMVMA